MKWLKKWLKWQRKQLNKLYRLWYQFRFRKLSVHIVNDIPDQTIPGILFLVGEDEDYWAASMRCPCGCNESITLNLIGQHPVWQAIEGQSGKITLHPSIHRQTGCRSHYWIRDEIVIWAI